MERDPALIGVLNIKPNHSRANVKKISKETSTGSLSSSSSSRDKIKKKKNSQSKYSVMKKKQLLQDEKNGRTLKRVRSQEEEEFTRSLPSKRNTGKVLKRKSSAESIQKMMRMKLAQKKTQRLRENRKRGR
jgi:hypothetical protein